VPTLDGDGWQLDSGVARHAEAPDSFEIPEESIRTRLVPGCLAKLIFTLRGTDGVGVERMWVQITDCTEAGYVGFLDNDPETPGSPVVAGDRVAFTPDHVIDAEPPVNWNPKTGEYEDA
jgi:hypothetical protein